MKSYYPSKYMTGCIFILYLINTSIHKYYGSEQYFEYMSRNPNWDKSKFMYNRDNISINILSPLLGRRLNIGTVRIVRNAVTHCLDDRGYVISIIQGEISNVANCMFILSEYMEMGLSISDVSSIIYEMMEV